MPAAFFILAYLLASVLFILGLKGLTHPRTARRGNLLGALGMLVAVLTALLDKAVLDYRLAAAGLAVGAVTGGVLALRVRMTAMPQMVAAFNGFGGLASALVAGAALYQSDADALPVQVLVAVWACGIVGIVTFSGSFVAFAKLQEIFPSGSLRFPLHEYANLLLALSLLVLGSFFPLGEGPEAFPWVVGIALVLGVTLVLPIGGADMPVVVALLNSYSGLAASATGFVLQNNVLIISGALVGASGLILTRIMCVAMNRSLTNVLFGTMGGSGPGGPSADDVYAGRIKSTNAEEVAMLLDGARSVVFVPGYGLAVAQAQHVLRDLAEALKKRGAEVRFAVHPVAGRMPGHMNVLLAEADVPYDELLDMDAANPLFPHTDMAIVVGANDVVNPDARENPNSPIAGMPILDVDKARTVVVIKRSLSPGYAGIPNPLFSNDNTLMFFADGKQAATELVAAVKEL